MPINAKALATGFFEQRVERIDAERGKAEKLTEQMKKMHIAGVKKQQEKYDKSKTSFDKIGGYLDAGDIDNADLEFTSAGIGAASAEKMSKQKGEDVVRSVDPEVRRKELMAHVNFFNENNTRPEVNYEEVQNIQARRGVDNLSFERTIRDLLGVDTSDNSFAGTAQKGLKLLHQTQRGKVEGGVDYEAAPEGQDFESLYKDEATVTDVLGNKVKTTIFRNKLTQEAPGVGQSTLTERGRAVRPLEAKEEKVVFREYASVLEKLDMKDPEKADLFRQTFWEPAGRDVYKPQGIGLGYFNVLFDHYRADSTVTVKEAASSTFDDLSDMYDSGALVQVYRPGLTSKLTNDVTLMLDSEKYMDWAREKMIGARKQVIAGDMTDLQYQRTSDKYQALLGE